MRAFRRRDTPPSLSAFVPSRRADVERTIAVQGIIQLRPPNVPGLPSVR